jgi:DNA-binding transcriptional MerR regulator
VLRPHKSRSGQRLYSREDVELIFRIKELLYEEKLTISGARKRIHTYLIDHRDRHPGKENTEEKAIRILREVREELKAIRDSL